MIQATSNSKWAAGIFSLPVLFFIPLCEIFSNHSYLINFLTELFRLKDSLSAFCVAKSEQQVAKSTKT